MNALLDSLQPGFSSSIVGNNVSLSPINRITDTSGLLVFVLKLACCVYYYWLIRSDFDQIYEKGKDKFPPKACTYFAVNGTGSDRLVLDRDRVKWSIIKPATIWFHQRQMPQPWVTWGKTRMFQTDMWKNNESDRKHETLQLLTPNYCPVYIYGHTSMFRETGVHVIA